MRTRVLLWWSRPVTRCVQRFRVVKECYLNEWQICCKNPDLLYTPCVQRVPGEDGARERVRASELHATVSLCKALMMADLLTSG